MSETGEPKPTIISRREFIRRGAKVVGGLLLGGGGLAVLSKLTYEAERNPDPLVSSLKSEVLPVEDEDGFKRGLKEKYNNIGTEADISTFAIVTSGKDKITKLSFAVVPVTEGQIPSRVFIQGETDNEPIELYRLVAPQVDDTDISWYIPEGIRTVGRPKMQDILSFRVAKKDDEVKAISFHPPDRETLFLAGEGVSSEKMARVHFPFTPDMLPDKALNSLTAK